jgi:hypothetical protein
MLFPVGEADLSLDGGDDMMNALWQDVVAVVTLSKEEFW